MTDHAQAAQNLSPDHLLALYEITAEMNSSLDFDEALNNIMRSVMHVMKAQRGFLMVAEPDTDELRVLVVQGLDGETLESEGYSTTIVNEVVKTRQTLLTNNAQFDTRFQAGQSIIMRGLRAILCAPMLTKSRLVGVIYVDTSMRAGNFSNADRDLLAAVAGQAGIALENARLYSVAVEKGRLERELQMASEIQQGLLPHHLPEVPGYEIAASWEAAREVAGDFYDAFRLGDDKFAIVVADVSDKGAPAALFMAVARTMIRSNSTAGLPPVETISRTNDLILDDAESGMFVTVYHSHFMRGGEGIHVNAGHNPPLLYRASSRSGDYLPRGGRAVGWFPDNPLSQVDIQLYAGDLILYYTDGLTEAQDIHGEFFGEERLAQLVVDNAHLNADDLMAIVLKTFKKFIEGVPPFDDVTIVIVKYVGE